MLVRELGKYAYAEARLMQNRAKSVQERRRWRDVALAVAGKTGRQVGLDTATRMAQGANFTNRGAPQSASPSPRSTLSRRTRRSRW